MALQKPSLGLTWLSQPQMKALSTNCTSIMTIDRLLLNRILSVYVDTLAFFQHLLRRGPFSLAGNSNATDVHCAHQRPPQMRSAHTKRFLPQSVENQSIFEAEK